MKAEAGLVRKEIDRLRRPQRKCATSRDTRTNETIDHGIALPPTAASAMAAAAASAACAPTGAGSLEEAAATSYHCVPSAASSAVPLHRQGLAARDFNVSSENLTHDLQCLQRRAYRAAPLLAAMSYMAPPEVRARVCCITTNVPGGTLGTYFMPPPLLVAFCPCAVPTTPPLLPCRSGEAGV